MKIIISFYRSIRIILYKDVSTHTPVCKLIYIKDMGSIEIPNIILYAETDFLRSQVSHMRRL